MDFVSDIVFDGRTEEALSFDRTALGAEVETMRHVSHRSDCSNVPG